MRRAIAWLGLLLLVGSLVHLYLNPVAPRPFASRSPEAEKSGEPFSLVILDPGHGGDDSGAVVDGLVEKDLALDVAKRAERLVRAQGLQTLLTRDGDSYVSLASRAALANRERDCVFISIHFNNEKKPTVP